MEFQITKPIKPALLAQQLLDAYPAWASLGILGIQMFQEEEAIRLVVPDDADQAAVQAIIDAHDPTIATRDETALDWIRQQAASAAGVKLQDLTAAQIKALLAVLLYKEGAVDAGTLTIRPLKEWAR